MASEVYVGRVRSVVLVTLLSIVTLGIYFFVWLVQINRDLRRHLGGGVKPGGRFALFLFVPVLGWFLSIFLTGRSVKRAQLNATVDSLIVPVYHAVWAGLVPVVGWLIAAGYLQRGANRAWLKMDHTLETVGTNPATIECPDCETRFATILNPLIPHPVRCPQCGRAGTV